MTTPGSGSSDLGSPQELLAAAIREPFFHEPDPEHPINRWLQGLAERCPLWTLRTTEFERLQETDLPSTYPLQPIIESVFRDEGLDRRGECQELPPGYRLLRNVYLRRKELGSGRRGVLYSCYARRKSDGSWKLGATDPSSLLSLTEPPPVVDWADEDPPAYFTIYEEIGRELVRQIEHRDSQKRGTDEAKQAQREIDRFLQSISARRGRGRPPRATSNRILTALYREGSELLEFVWTAHAAAPSATTQECLADHGITDPTEQGFWATHLALPMLSTRELTAVYRYAGGEGWLTPRRLAILFISRRLDVDGPHVARRVVGSDEEEEFSHHGDLPI